MTINNNKAQLAEFIIRCSKNRLLKNDKTKNEANTKKHKKLKEKVLAVPVLGIIEFDIPATKIRKSRHIVQEVRAIS